MSQKSNESHKSIAELEHQISMLIAENDSQKEEINNLRQKLEHMNEILLNMQRARFGQSSEKQEVCISRSAQRVQRGGAGARP